MSREDFVNEGYKEAQRARREKRLPVRTGEILALRAQGYKVERKTEYHFRVNGTIDLWPIHNRWHNIKTGERGGARNLAEFIRQKLKCSK